MQYLRKTQWIPWSLAVICLTATWAVAQPKASSGATTKPKPETESPVLEATRPNGLKIAARDADLRAVLQMLSAQGKMNIIATKEVSGKVTVDLHDVTFQEALEAVLESSGFVHRQKGNFIYIYTPSQLEKILMAERKKVVRSFRLAYISAKDAKSLITPALSKDGTIAVTPDLDVYQMGSGSSSGSSGGGSGGGGGSSTDAPTNYASSEVLVIQDYEDNMKHIEKIVQEIDAKPQQVLIEATILQATLSDNNALGIDFTSLAGVDFQTFSANASSPAPPGFNNAAATDSVTPSGAIETNFASNVPAGGVSIGVLTNNIAFFIRALERITDTTVLANPKILVVNKQKGEVLIGRSDGYVASTTQTETSATATVEFLDSGIRLAVRPFVGKDGYIRMQIHPEDSDGRVVQVGTTALPSKTTTEVTSNVMVRDGHTIVLGGLFRERTVTSRNQVPLVGNVPYLGTLFRSTVDETIREEIIVLLTPRIINQDVDEAVGDQLACDAERFRVGGRKGVRWWGRVRLANTYVGWAKEAMAEGDYAKALWNVDLALSMDPRLIEAIRLKEQLTGKAYWAKEATNTSVRYLIQQMVMQELNKPMDPVITPGRPLDVEKIDPKVREAFGIRAKPASPKMEIKKVEVIKSSAKAAGQPKEAPKAATQPAKAPTKTIIIKKEATVTVRPQEPPPSAPKTTNDSPRSSDVKNESAILASEAK